MSRYLTDLADVCRSTGLPVIEVDGWQTRARGSGGYATGKPDHVMCHHTASGPGSDGWPDVNYCTFGDEDAPLCNLYLSRDGTVYVCAAGGTNTNGKGDCAHLSPDSMNSSAVGIEAGNGGTGEPWPTAQTTAYQTLCAALCAAYGIAHDHCHSHAEWAPDRKVDPFGPSPWGDGTWNMDAFRGDLDSGRFPPQPPEDPDMLTPEESRMLRELHDTLTGPISPRFTDPGGVPLDVPWAVGWTWEYVAVNHDQKLNEILARLDRLEDDDR